MRYRLGDVCSRLSSGKTISASAVADAGLYPVYGANGLRGYTNSSNFKGQCALIGRQGAYCGNVKYFSGEGYITEHAVVLQANGLADTQYLAYRLSILDLGRLSGQSAQPGLSVKDLSNQIVDLPSLDVQRSVANLLSALDRKIALNRRKIATLEKMAKEIYEYSLKDHQNIEICKVSDIVNVRTGKMDANFATPLGKYPFFTCSDQVLRCDELAFRGSAVLLAGNGNFGVKFYDGEFNAYQRTYVLIPHNTDMFGTLYCAVKRMSEVLSSKSAGSIVKFITKGDVESINVPYHRTMGLKINACLKQILALEKSSSSLMELRDFLLPLLMNGQVQVGELYGAD